MIIFQKTTIIIGIIKHVSIKSKQRNKAEKFTHDYLYDKVITQLGLEIEVIQIPLN
jgi:hypothetical protein